MIIDRFEGDFAACETETGIAWVQKKLLPPGAKEGDVLVMGEDGMAIDVEKTEKRRQSTKQLMERVFVQKP